VTTYRDNTEGVTEGALGGGFFEGWPDPPSPATHLRLLHGSDVVVLALDGDRVVGFVTAITDGVLSAYIPLLEVLPEHRGQGIGRELIRLLMDRLAGLYMVDASCDTDLVAFYEQFGMQRGGAAMIRRDYAAQSGRRPNG